MKRLIVPVAMAILFLSACTQSQPEPASPTAAPPDYTVVTKSFYLASADGGAGKLGYYVTIVLGGAVYETLVPDGVASDAPSCFTDTKIGTVLPPECR